MATAIAPRGILDAHGKPLSPRNAPRQFEARARVAYQLGIRAGFDAAKTTNENQRHWSQADALSADAAGNASVRALIRQRARYEIANNTYAKGIILTLANFCVGTGPRLQLLTPDKAVNNSVERAWRKWAQATRFAAKLRTLRMARAGDGEAFTVFINNPRLNHPVQLDIALIEADRVTELNPIFNDSLNADGVMLDQYGNPVAYKVLKEHPGGQAGVLPQSETIPADKVMHTFRQDRPEQHRGISEICPALPHFAQLRDWDWAVGEAAKLAAVQSGWLETANPADEPEEQGDAFEAFEVQHNTWNVAPYGYKAMQLKAEQPTTTHDMYTRTQLAAIARCLNMPYNIAAGNSGNSNMASARLDCQLFYSQMDVDREDLEITVCDTVLDAWLLEAGLIGILPRGLGLDVPHVWMWPPYPEPDPVAAAQAFEIRRRNGADTIARSYMRDGEDPEPHLKTWKEEVAIVPIPGASLNGAPGQSENPAQQSAQPAATPKEKHNEE